MGKGELHAESPFSLTVKKKDPSKITYLFRERTLRWTEPFTHDVVHTLVPEIEWLKVDEHPFQSLRLSRQEWANADETCSGHLIADL